MKSVIVETSGLCHYEITGDRAEEAAEDLRRRLDFINRDYYTRTPLEDIAAARRTVAELYSVEIRAEV